MSSPAEAGASRLIDILQGQGYTRTDRGAIALLHHRQFRLSRFGVVDSVVGIAVEAQATADSFRSLDTETKDGARELKSAWPLGFGGMVEMFPVLFADEAEPAAVEAATSSAPKRWGIMSSHALVHGRDQQVALFEGRALWGGAYVAGLRSKLLGWLDAAA